MEAVHLGHPILTVFRIATTSGNVQRHHVVTHYEGVYSAIEAAPSASSNEEKGTTPCDGVVSHHIDASFHPRYVGRTLERKVFLLNDDTTLELSGPLGMLPGNPIGVLRWQRRSV